MINKRADQDLLMLVKEVLDIEADVTFETELNIFDYDSLAKVSLIVAIETWTVNRLDMNKFLLCDTFQDLVNLIKETGDNN